MLTRVLLKKHMGNKVGLLTGEVVEVVDVKNSTFVGVHNGVNKSYDISLVCKIEDNDILNKMLQEDIKKNGTKELKEAILKQSTERLKELVDNKKKQDDTEKYPLDKLQEHDLIIMEKFGESVMVEFKKVIVKNGGKFIVCQNYKGNVVFEVSSNHYMGRVDFIR